MKCLVYDIILFPLTLKILTYNLLKLRCYKVLFERANDIMAI